jgi:hypothetical protein
VLSCCSIFCEWVRRKGNSDFKIALLLYGFSMPLPEMILTGREPIRPAVNIITLLSKSLADKVRGIIRVKVVPVL